MVYHIRTGKMLKRSKYWRPYLNGRYVENCFYADPRRGVVRFWYWPDGRHPLAVKVEQRGLRSRL
jgi:hypothetical protein